MRHTFREKLMLAVALVFTAIYLFPLYWMYVTALKSGWAIFASPPAFWPADPQWQIYAEVWQSRNMGRYIWNSLVIAFGAVAPMCWPATEMAGWMSVSSSSSCCRSYPHR